MVVWNQIGQFLWKRARYVTTKYGFDCDLDESRKRVTNQIWKLIPLWEENADWEKQLNSVIIEIAGLNEIFKGQVNFLTLLSKLEGMRIIKHFEPYRRNVFESITMFNDLYHE